MMVCAGWAVPGGGGWVVAGGGARGVSGGGRTIKGVRDLDPAIMAGAGRAAPGGGGWGVAGSTEVSPDLELSGGSFSKVGLLPVSTGGSPVFMSQSKAPAR